MRTLAIMAAALGLVGTLAVGRHSASGSRGLVLRPPPPLLQLRRRIWNLERLSIRLERSGRRL